MNESNTSQFREFVLRRLTEPLQVDLHFVRFEMPGFAWAVILGLILIVALVYVVWMYIKDSRAVGIGWAFLLGTLRTCVYVLLAGVFLLPAEQSWEEVRLQSKVLVLFDVSGSLSSIDDIPTGKPNEKLQTRQDKVLAFLSDKKFIENLETNNPVTAFRFASRLDEDFLLFRNGRTWTKEEWEEYLRATDRNVAIPPQKPWAADLRRAWLNPDHQKPEAPEDLSSGEKQQMEQLAKVNRKLKEAGFFNSTNLGDSLLTTINRELNNMVQGVVVFTDGRSTEGSSQTIQDVVTRAKAANIPIFVVGVGSVRPQVRIEVVDVRVPDQVQPEDHFRAVIEVTGEGLSDKPADVTLELKHVRKGRDGKDEAQPIQLVEAADKDNPSKERASINLGQSLVLQPKEPAHFDRSMPPRALAEFPLSAADLAAAAKIDLKSGDYADKKWEIEETKEGELQLQARIPRDRLEAYTAPMHLSDKTVLRVIKKPLRVLLFASSATRDYQFLRTILVREMKKGRAEVSIHMQLPPNVRERKPGMVQDVPPERLLSAFPTELEGTDKENPLYALSMYDVIVAFDPDWTQLTDQQLKMVQKWVDKGGGLIAVGGPINTLTLARPGDYKEKLKPILDLYPVNLRDIRVDEMERTTSDPFPLDFSGATEDMEFLKLEEGNKDQKFLADWDAFFYGGAPKDKGPERGFYSFYPLENAKPGAVVVARFNDPRGRLKDGTLQPYIVLTPQGSGRRVVWLGSGETWRLRQYKTLYHERFWSKLMHYAGAGNMAKINKRIRLEMGTSYTQNQPVEVEAKIDGRGGEPLPPDAKPPEISLELPLELGAKPEKLLMRAKPRSEGWFVGRFQPRYPGEYNLHLSVPETGDALSKRFSVKPANPEMDNTRPDFKEMYDLASEADLVLARLADTEKAELRKRLQRAHTATSVKSEEDKPRLYFSLDSADVIPACMTKKEDVRRNRGPVKDLWDDGVTVWERPAPQPPVKLSYVLIAAVGLLSMEWLIRKLLRLA
jgi:hypothetical protein